MELFEEQGFEDTTAVQIAKRARVTTRTFFRYFSDKQEVLFADEDVFRGVLVRQMHEATDVAEPLHTVTRTLAEYDWEGLGSRESLRRREAMIASTPYLQERELIKQHQMAEEFSTALQRHGVEPELAELAAHVGVQVFRIAYRLWLEGGDAADLTAAITKVTSRLATIVPADATAPRGRAPSARPRKSGSASPSRRRATAMQSR